MAVSSRFHAKCVSCARAHSIESSEGGYCSECATNIKLQANSEPNVCCVRCDKRFYSPNSVRVCPFCSVKGYSRTVIKPKTYDNEKVVEKKKRKAIPLDELIRRSEYKRVMDDSGWDHYLRGRKWDKV